MMYSTDGFPSMPTSSTPLVNPQAPIRRAMTAIFRSPLQVSSHPRPRSNSLDSANPTVSRPIVYTPLPAVALQTPCLSTDSIIITSLRRAPFCCHEDLVTMPRPNLVRVAQSINGRLPKALQIACGDDLHDVDIRRAIEVLVGIRAETTSCSAQAMGLPRVAPTNNMSATFADETHWNMDVDSSAMDLDEQRSIIPSSPLSIRGRPLEILKEEQEHEEPLEEQRSSSPEDAPAAGPVSTASCSRLIENLDMSASRLLSSDSIEYVRPVTNTQENLQRQRSSHLSDRSPQPHEVVIRLPFTSPPKAQPTLILRSHSHRASIKSASSQVSSLKRTLSDASAMLKRPRYHFKRGTSKVVDHSNLPEVEESHALPICTGSALVDVLRPRG